MLASTKIVIISPYVPYMYLHVPLQFFTEITPISVEKIMIQQDTGIFRNSLSSYVDIVSSNQLVIELS